jgi:hydrogenase nickel incorporation protein HypA/HybF
VHALPITRWVVRRVAAAAGGRRVVVVRMRVGALSGVVPDALRFAWDVAVLDGPLAGARLEVEQVPVAVACRDCGRTSDLADPLPVRCPACGGREVDLVRGREIEVVDADVADEGEAAA